MEAACWTRPLLAPLQSCKFLDVSKSLIIIWKRHSFFSSLSVRTELLEVGFWHRLTCCTHGSIMFWLIQPHAFVSLMRHFHLIAICFATVNYRPQCLPSALFSVGGVFRQQAVMDAWWEMTGLKIQMDNLDSGWREGLIGAQPQFVLLLMEKHHRGKTNACPRLEANKPSVLVSPHSTHFLFKVI